jgi:hypothetical protein
MSFEESNVAEYHSVDCHVAKKHNVMPCCHGSFWEMGFCCVH